LKRKPTPQDYADWIDHQLALVEREALREVKKIEAEQAARGMFQSGGTVTRVHAAMEEKLNLAIQTALAELQSAVDSTDLDNATIYAKTVAALEELLRRLSNVAGDVGRRVSHHVAGTVAEQIEKWKAHLALMIRQFEAGFYKPNLPTGVISMTKNEINIQGSVTGSAIQQGSPNANQNIKVTAETFAEIKSKIEKGVADDTERAKIIAALDELKEAALKRQEVGGSHYGVKYQAFIAAAANHMTIVAPFIPLLTTLL
jgi:hypothetical protein